MRLAITGGTGFVGHHLNRHLLDLGHELVLISRGEKPIADDLRGHEKVKPVTSNLDSSAALVDCFEGCQAVFHCAGINRERGAQDYRSVHVEGTRNVLAACRQAGVPKVILVSFLRARPHPDSPYHQSKWEAEELVRSSGLTYTILKAGVIYGSGDHLTRHLRTLFQTLPIPLFGQVGFKDQTARPLAIEDLVRLMVCCLADPRLENKTIPVVGPEELPITDMVRRIAKSCEVNPIIIPLPVVVHRLMAWFLERVTSDPLVTLSQVQMLAEGLSEPAKAPDSVPTDLNPTTKFLA